MELHDSISSYESEEEILQPRCGREELPPADVDDPVLGAFKKDVDRTLLIENLKLTPQQRSEKFLDFMRFVYELQRAGRIARGEEP